MTEGIVRFPISKLIDLPTLFEWLSAHVIGYIFNIRDVLSRYNVTLSEIQREMVIWRGKEEGLERIPIRYAPPGPDILVRSHENYFVIMDVTLATTERRLEQEVRSVVNHSREFLESSKVSEECFTLLLYKSLTNEATYWLSRIADELMICVLSIEEFTKLVKIAYYSLGPSHSHLRHLILLLNRQLQGATEIEILEREIRRCLSSWSERLISPNLPLFLALKAYEKLRAKGVRVYDVNDLRRDLMRDEEIVESLRLIGRPRYIRANEDWITYMEFLSLCLRESPSTIRVLEPGDFSRKILKLVSFVRPQQA